MILAVSASVFDFPQRAKGPQPWTNDELAELYRVVEILGNAGLQVETEMGLSDEGDPWFVFCRRDTGDVIAHFARIGGNFVAASIAVDATYRGANFRQIVERMVESQPLILPPPTAGSRLLLHPSVILVAFVATALAHSDKMLAVDWLQSVDAKWDHRPEPDGQAAATKSAWFDQLHGWVKSLAHDEKAMHDGSSKEAQALSLASLIAIAMTALQPVMEKMSVIANVVIDEVSGQSHTASAAGNSHSVRASQEMPVIDGATLSSGEQVAVLPPTGEPAHTPHKLVVNDTSADPQHTDQAADMAHVAVAPVPHSLSSDDSRLVAPQPPVEQQADNNGAFLLQQQKAVAVAMLDANIAPAVHNDPAAAPPPITFDKVSHQALVLLTIDNDAGTPTQLNQPSFTAPEAHPLNAVVASTDPAPTVVAPAPVPAVPLVVGNQEINVAAVAPAAVIDAIANFVSAGNHAVTQAINPSTNLMKELSPFMTGGTSLEVIAFDSSSPTADVIDFAPGVVLVPENVLSPTHLSNSSGNLILDLQGGGNITIVGVATIGQHSATV